MRLIFIMFGIIAFILLFPFAVFNPVITQDRQWIVWVLGLVIAVNLIAKALDEFDGI